MAQFDSKGTQTMEDLMALADLAMYENKRRKKVAIQSQEPGPDFPALVAAVA